MVCVCDVYVCGFVPSNRVVRLQDQQPSGQKSDEGSSCSSQGEASQTEPAASFSQFLLPVIMTVLY